MTSMPCRRVAGLVGDAPHGAAAFERGQPELGRRDEPDAMAPIKQQRLHEVRQQPEALGDDALIRRERQQILDDQAKALAPKPYCLPHPHFSGKTKPAHAAAASQFFYNVTPARRSIPTDEVLAEMRQADPPVSYLVGTPKGRLSKLEKTLLARPWQDSTFSSNASSGFARSPLLCYSSGPVIA
jgi:hypothetical protein